MRLPGERLNIRRLSISRVNLCAVRIFKTSAPDFAILCCSLFVAVFLSLPCTNMSALLFRNWVLLGLTNQFYVFFDQHGQIEEGQAMFSACSTISWNFSFWSRSLSGRTFIWAFRLKFLCASLSDTRTISLPNDSLKHFITFDRQNLSRMYNATSKGSRKHRKAFH